MMPNKKILPALVTRGVVPLPNNDFRIEVGRPFSLKALDEAEDKYGKYLVLLIQKNPLIDIPTPEDVEEYGVLAKLAMKIKLPNDTYKVKFNIIKRIKVVEYTKTEDVFEVEYEELEEVFDGDIQEVITTVKMITTEIAKNPTQLLDSQMVLEKIEGETTPDKIADIIAYNLKINELQKYKYVEEPDVLKRLKFILMDINQQKMIVELEEKINAEVKKAIDENQKEYYLRERMKAIQNELGDRAKREEDMERLRKQIGEAGMPKEIEAHALSELSRLQSTSSFMAEANVIQNYLEFIVKLPWYKTSEDRNDLSEVKKILDANHYGLDKVKDRIIEYLSVKIKTNKNPQTILCLVGPPGVGKTSLGISIAEALGRKFVKHSLGGVKDESEIRGHRRTYVGAMPGRILKSMEQAQTVNPVFLLDEIDKLSSDYKGDPASAMLEVLDPEQNSKFSDHYLEVPYDLSQVLFITTANYLENIPAPLRDRMEIVQLTSYTEIEKQQIARNHLLKEQLEAHGITEAEFSITDEAILEIIQYYTREAGVRELARHLGSLIRKAIKKILLEKVEKVEITNKNLEEYLGKHKFIHNLADKKSQVGVVTGLAYTAYGGDTLPVEVTYYKGKGNLVLTGKLGDVMKESAQTALSYIKSKAEEYKIDPNLFLENDFHIHVPEGAIPKDGPSAGITIATAIYSAVTNKLVRNDVGMTGEVTLRGLVLPIGGLKEKSIAADRSGLKTIIIPKENESDIDEIPEEVKAKLEIVLVSEVNEVFDIVIQK
ncbi:MAG TPA: endopeptidase La [Acholeplasmataceae bacterium]|jgi:ATP-dependent Lon protease|nr:endopeptidase La [Acholeplasmataceae bacterium]